MTRSGTFVCSLASTLVVFTSFHPTGVSDFDPSNTPLIERIYAPFDSLRTSVADYAWPTSEQLRITSAFADFRDNHFHGGIDISTNNRLGYPVYASRDGYVVRVQVSPYGYGKMIYVRHADGFTTTYNHLQKFNDRIERIVRQRQYASERYGVTILLAPGELPVRKGEQIAYSGNTGVGDAHLHFEIRDEAMNPVNPLLFPAVYEHTHDVQAPVFRKLAAEPMNASSTVNGDFVPQLFEVRRMSEGEFVVPEVLHLRGSIGLSVKASDIIDKISYENRANEFLLFIDGAPVFESRIHRFPDADTKQIAFYYDWPLWKSGEGYFQKLFVDEGNRLPFYKRAPQGTGIIECNRFAEGVHELEIIARDVHGNRARLKATAAFRHEPSFGALPPKQERRPFRRASIFSFALLSEFSLPTFLNTLRAESKLGSATPASYVILDQTKSSNTSLTIKKQFVRDFLYVSVASSLPLTIRPSVWLTRGEERTLLDLSARDANLYVAALPIASEHSGFVRIDAYADVNGSREVNAFDEFAVYAITSERGGTISSRDGAFSLKFGANAVFGTLVCRVEKTQSGYEVFPQDELLDAGAVVEYAVSEGLLGARVGLFTLSGSSSWSLLDWNKEGKTLLSAKVNQFLGEYALLRDEAPPEISRVQARYKRGVLTASFGVRDNLAGVAGETIRMYIDNDLIIGEYDPYQKRVKFEEEYELSSGAHTFHVEAADRMGNKREVEREFWVR